MKNASRYQEGMFKKITQPSLNSLYYCIVEQRQTFLHLTFNLYHCDADSLEFMPEEKMSMFYIEIDYH
jgi:hypothetical protein